MCYGNPVIHDGNCPDCPFENDASSAVKPNPVLTAYQLLNKSILDADENEKKKQEASSQEKEAVPLNKESQNNHEHISPKQSPPNVSAEITSNDSEHKTQDKETTVTTASSTQAPQIYIDSVPAPATGYFPPAHMTQPGFPAGAPYGVGYPAGYYPHDPSYPHGHAYPYPHPYPSHPVPAPGYKWPAPYPAPGYSPMTKPALAPAPLGQPPTTEYLAPSPYNVHNATSPNPHLSHAHSTAGSVSPRPLSATTNGTGSTTPGTLAIPAQEHHRRLSNPGSYAGSVGDQLDEELTTEFLMKKSKRKLKTDWQPEAEWEDEETVLKRRKNTEAARRSRMKKTLRLEALEIENKKIEQEKSELAMRVVFLESESKVFASKLAASEERNRSLERQLEEAHRTVVSLRYSQQRGGATLAHTLPPLVTLAPPINHSSMPPRPLLTPLSLPQSSHLPPQP